MCLILNSKSNINNFKRINDGDYDFIYLWAWRSIFLAVVCSVIEQWHHWKQTKEYEVSIDPQTECETYWEASS